MAVDKTLYNWNVNNTYIPPSGLVISSVFDTAHKDLNLAPIDMFIQKSVDLNKLILDPNNLLSEILRLQRKRKISNFAFNSITSFIHNTANISPTLANLVLLGHISAVESYFRELFRRLILVDEFSQEVCREKELSYGAAITHRASSLPDALLEQINFASGYNIKESLRDYLGYKGEFPNSINEALLQFSKICQLRHCIVHRFGKLGVNNAMRIDWDTHRSHIEKPVKLDYASLQEIAQICSNVIKEINNFTWQFVMMRQIADGNYNNYKKKRVIKWTWDWKKDKGRFKKYYDIFISKQAAPAIVNMARAYDTYKVKYTNLP